MPCGQMIELLREHDRHVRQGVWGSSLGTGHDSEDGDRYLDHGLVGWHGAHPAWCRVRRRAREAMRCYPRAGWSWLALTLDDGSDLLLSQVEPPR